MDEDDIANELESTIKEFNQNRNRSKSETFVKAIVPDGGWGWIVCLACFTMTMMPKFDKPNYRKWRGIMFATLGLSSFLFCPIMMYNED